MKVEIDLRKCKLNGITPDQYILLYLIYHKEYKKIESLFTRSYAIIMRDSLQHTKYILGKEKLPFKQTILSHGNVCKLLGISADNIEFVEFYSEYPIKVGTRILRAGNVDTNMGRKHQKKYLTRVTTIEEHEQAIKAIKVFVAKQKQAGQLQYLPNMETVLNNSMWETWDSLIDIAGTEGKNWSDQTI